MSTPDLDWRDSLNDDPIPAWALSAARAEFGLTQAELARELRCTTQAIYNWEHGHRPISGPTAAAIEHFFKNIRPTS